MDFSPPPRRKPNDNLLPMINVVFLLLIFFLISARLTPTEAIAVTPPVAQTQSEALGEFALLIGPDGALAYRDETGPAALAALAKARQDHCAAADCGQRPPRLSLRADTHLPANRLAALLPQIAALGFAQVELVVLPGAAG